MLQAKVTDDAMRRIKAEAGRRLCTIGSVVNELAVVHLPEIPTEDSGRNQDAK